MNKISCVLLLISTQFILHCVTAAGTGAKPPGRLAAKRFGKRAAPDKAQCSLTKDVSLNFPADLKQRDQKDQKGNSRTITCPDPDVCRVDNVIGVPCTGGKWHFIINSTYINAGTDLHVFTPNETVFTSSSNTGVLDESRYDIEATRLLVDISAVNVKEQAEVSMAMYVCCQGSKAAGKPGKRLIGVDY